MKCVLCEAGSEFLLLDNLLAPKSLTASKMVWECRTCVSHKTIPLSAWEHVLRHLTWQGCGNLQYVRQRLGIQTALVPPKLSSLT